MFGRERPRQGEPVEPILPPEPKPPKIGVTEFDLDDPQILEMLNRGHTPEDAWSIGGELATVSCSRCGHDWPCPKVQRLRSRR